MVRPELGRMQPPKGFSAFVLLPGRSIPGFVNVEQQVKFGERMKSAGVKRDISQHIFEELGVSKSCLVKMNVGGSRCSRCATRAGG